MTYALVLLSEEEAVDGFDDSSYTAQSVIAPFDTELLASAWWFARPHLHDDYAYEIVPMGAPSDAMPPQPSS